MDIGKSFGFVFEDEKWIEKVLIGGLVGLIPLIGSFLVIGYVVQLIRNVRNGDSHPLPEWTEWGELLADGFKLFIVFFVWALPLIVLFMLAFIPAAMAGDASSGDASSIAGLFATCFGCIAFLYAIVLSLASPAILIKFAETKEIGSGFNISEILGFTKSHIGEIILVVIVSWLVGLLASIVGTILCLIGLLFTGFWSNLVISHMMAQIGLNDTSTPDLLQPAPSVEELSAPSEDTLE